MSLAGATPAQVQAYTNHPWNAPGSPSATYVVATDDCQTETVDCHPQLQHSQGHLLQRRFVLALQHQEESQEQSTDNPCKLELELV